MMNYVQRQLLGMGIWVLLALVSSLGIALFTTKHPRAVESDRLLPGLIDSDPRLLVLVRANEEVRFAKSQTSEGWLAQAPWDMPADPNAIEQVIAALRDIRVIRRVQIPAHGDLSKDLRDMGVEAPKFTWRVALGHEEWTLKFGVRAPGARQGMYLALTDSGHAAPTVYVVDAYTAPFDVQPEQLLDTRLLRLRAAEVREFVVDSPPTRVHGRKGPHSERWFSVDSPHVRLDPEQVAALFGSLSSLRASPHPLATRGAAERHPSAAIKLVLQAGEASIELLNRCSEDPRLLWMRMPGSREKAVCADGGLLQQALRGGAERWHDTQLFRLRMDEVESVTHSFDKHKTEVLRDGTDFLVTGPVPTRLALTTGNDYLAELLSVHGQIVGSSEESSFPDSGDYIEIRSSTATHDGDTLVERVVLGPVVEGGARRVKRHEDGTVLQIERSVAEVLQLGPRIRAPKRLIDVSPRQIQRITPHERGHSIKLEPAKLDELRVVLATLTAEKATTLTSPHDGTELQIEFDVVGDTEPAGHQNLHVVVEAGRCVGWLEDPEHAFEFAAGFLAVLSNVFGLGTPR